jgi:hypothetical protein
MPAQSVQQGESSHTPKRQDNKTTPIGERGKDMDLIDIKAIAQQKISVMEPCSNKELLNMLWYKDFTNLGLTEAEERKLIRKGIHNLQYQYDVARAGLRRASKEIDRLRQIEIRESAARLPGNGKLVLQTGETSFK